MIARRRSPFWTAVAVCVLLATAWSCPYPGSAASPGTGTWTVLAPRGASAAASDLFAIQCPAVTVCYALGSPFVGQPGHPTLARTADGGVTWTTLDLATNPYVPNLNVAQPLSCPTPDTCYLLTGTVAGQEVPPTPGTTPVPLGPPEIWVSQDSGHAWVHENPHISGVLQAISCPGAKLCYVVASGAASGSGLAPETLLVTRDGGATWVAMDLSKNATSGPPGMFSCPAADTCYLGATLPVLGEPNTAQALVATHDGGSTWTSFQVGQQAGYQNVSCPSAETCFAAGSTSVAATHDGGRSWETLPAPWQNTGTPWLACPSESSCYAMGYGGIWTSSDGANTWAASETSVGYVGDIACPGTTLCYAVGAAGLVIKTVDGKTWREPTPYTRQSLGSISCPAPRTCYAGGAGGAVLVTTDNGATWIRRRVGAAANAQVSCPAARTCLALTTSIGGSGVSIERTTDGGESWKTLQSYPWAFGGAIRCPTASACFAETFDSRVTVADGLPAGTTLILRTANGGDTWFSYRLPEGYLISSLSCPTARMCMAVGGQSPCNDDARPKSAHNARSERSAPRFPCSEELGWLFATTDGGQHWRRELFRARELYSVSCSGPAECYASGDGVWAETANGGVRWKVTVTSVQTPTSSPSLPLGNLWCTGHSTCWALRGSPYGGAVPVLTTNAGRSWVAITRGLPFTNPTYESGLTALTCHEAGHCLAVGGGGLIVSYSE